MTTGASTEPDDPVRIAAEVQCQVGPRRRHRHGPACCPVDQGGLGMEGAERLCAEGRGVAVDLRCGDDELDPGETCDGTDLAGQTCQSQGFQSGTLDCSQDCLAFDTSGCVNAVCGNDVCELQFRPVGRRFRHVFVKRTTG